ncbi:hypothetical protein BS50DRAFT_414000 [Corynespora cassiicola Philippines]|uniref:Uncharacterized protein n=1 Tax=Corynespora cassiicola Philippines TaxID=1448308 RepID=A0A2T2NMW7_CORCC|nr:hypothetical protein BS50DRAFT_414000 [Corynespora cassiicola Philippines]
MCTRPRAEEWGCGICLVQYVQRQWVLGVDGLNWVNGGGRRVQRDEAALYGLEEPSWLDATGAEAEGTHCTIDAVYAPRQPLCAHVVLVWHVWRPSSLILALGCPRSHFLLKPHARHSSTTRRAARRAGPASPSEPASILLQWGPPFFFLDDSSAPSTSAAKMPHWEPA